MIERKEITTFEQQYIYDLEAFGWDINDITSEVVDEKSQYYTVIYRDNSMPHYDLLCKLESDYDKERANLKEYKPMNVGIIIFISLFIFLLGYILIVIPTKNYRKQKVEDHNKKCRVLMEQIMEQARQLR